MNISEIIKRLPITLWKALSHIDCIAARELRTAEKEYPQVASCTETLDKLIVGASISRFGDGELAVCLGRTVNYTNAYNPKLQRRLLDVLHSPQTEKFLIGIPPMTIVQERQRKRIAFRTKLKMFVWRYLLLQAVVDSPARRWTFFETFLIRHWRFLKKRFREKYYANAYISRPEVFAEVPLEKWRRVWDNRNVVFIVPKNGRFVNDKRVFGNIKSAQWIYVDPIDAFADYDHTYRLACDLSHDIELPLFLIAAGQTATLLAYDLYRAGYQAIDIGHLPNSYAAYLGEIKTPEDIPPVRRKRD
ncbi:MAG: GT-D fold domain-containing protein [Planctomycetaceae bacterium]|jgi:hypothetical protein|nr:GT-D fold domain-containing protein [Planctomycetaceae bacterium]